ncbi:MAG: DNA polymerase III subunit gamma/tau [Anaerolineales bacterium]|nr:DNA polymerase III subunit gamma/tau [Anaerolineales bacterium]
MSQAYYRKWRPQRWDQIIGQDHVVTTLRNAVAADRVAHAYLFAGPRGTGKTTTARLLAKAVNCLDEDLARRPCDSCENCVAVNQAHFLDLIEIDAASNTSVDDVRDLREKINFSPNKGRFKVYIIDEVHMLSTAAFNALLKTLEEPPPHAIFILATTEVHKIPATVLSRCQRHEFRRVPVADILARLEEIAEAEQVDVDADALQLIARHATGSVRDAISLLDQLASAGERVNLEYAQLVLGTATSQSVLDLVDSLPDREPARGLNLIQAELDSGSDPRQFARQIVDYLHSVLLLELGSGFHVDATEEVKERMAEHALLFGRKRLLAVVEAFNRAASDNRSAWKPGLPLELAYMDGLAAMEENPAANPQPPAEAPAEPMADPDAANVDPDPPSNSPRPDEEVGETRPAVAEGQDAQGAEADPLSPKGISRAWPEVLARSRKRNPQTQGLLNSCKPLGIKDNTIVLGFSSDIIKSKMEKPEHLAVVKEVLAEVFGVELKVSCIVTSAAQGDKLKDLEGVDRDGIVAVAVRDLGGEIVDIQD